MSNEIKLFLVSLFSKQSDNDVIFKTMYKDYTVLDIKDGIMTDEFESVNYAKTLLIVARDILRSQANKHDKRTKIN